MYITWELGEHLQWYHKHFSHNAGCIQEAKSPGEWKMEELILYNALFLKMSGNHLHCFWKQTYEDQDSALLIHTSKVIPAPHTSQIRQVVIDPSVSADARLLIKNKIQHSRRQGYKKKKGEKESIFLIWDLIFLSLPHPTCTNILHKILTTSFRGNMNVKKKLRFWESFWESS